MTDSSCLTFSEWIATTIARWKLAGGIIGSTLLLALTAALMLPPVYEAHASFLPPGPGRASITAAARVDARVSEFALPRATVSADDKPQSPRFYVQLIESEEVRRRLLVSKFVDPRRSSLTDSATLLDILNVRNPDPARRVEIASKRLAKAITAKVDPESNLIRIDARARWPRLAADVANRAIQVVDQFTREQHTQRSHSRRVFLQSRVDSVAGELQSAELQQRQFYERNRAWRSSPHLVFEEARLQRDASSAADFYTTLEQELQAARLDEMNDAVTLTIIDAAVAPRKAQWPRYLFLLASALGAAIILGGLVAGGTTILSRSIGSRARSIETPEQRAVAQLSLVSSAGAPVMPPSSFSRVVFAVFACGLVFHSLLIAAMFGWFGLPQSFVREFAAWKEAGLALLVIIVIVRSATGRGPRTVIVPTDLWVGGLIATAVLLLLTENLWLRFGLPAAAQLLGIRDAVYFMLAYFIGRTMPELASDQRTMRTLFVVVVITAVIGVLERLLVTPEMLVALGVASYYQDFLGLSAFTVGNEYGLPLNYWTRIGGILFRRAGSVYLSGQGFAVPFLLFFPLATSWVFMRARRSVGQIAAYAIVSIALLLTVTRLTIIIALIQLMLFTSIRKRPVWAIGAVGALSAVFVAALLTIPGFPSFVWQTLSFQESSSASHVRDWVKGLVVFAENPWGSGLGTADQTAVRAGLRHLTGDNLYLKYAVEMGIAGLSFFVLALYSIGATAMRLYRRGPTQAEQRTGMTLWLATIGIALNGVTAVVFNSITLGWIFFWLAGAAVTAANRATAESPVGQLVPRRPTSRGPSPAGAPAAVGNA